jgi:hypothetical protein
MGDEVRRKPGSRVRIRFAAADSSGLTSIRIVSRGRVVREIPARGARVVSGELQRVVGKTPAYFRVECTASDQRRAFSSPIFVSPK